jgi:hypothetical protein
MTTDHWADGGTEDQARLRCPGAYHGGQAIATIDTAW